MIKKRIIPTLSFRNNGLVKSRQFKHYRMLGDPVQAIKVYNLRDVDELIFVDISENSKRPNVQLIKDILQYAFMPITVGGGINSLEDISCLLESGADKVCISFKAFENYEFIEQAVSKFGQQAIVISIDYLEKANDAYLVFNPGFNLCKTDILEHVQKLSHIGVSEFVITSIDREGEMTGYDLDFINKIEKITQAGLVMNGGAGNYEHMLKAFQETNVVGVGAASMFHFTEQTPKGANNYLKQNNIKVRN